MNSPVLLGLSSLLLATAVTHGDTVITEDFTYTPSIFIPDNDINGVVQVFHPSTSIGFIENIGFSLEVSGGWNGDLYAYLWHDGEISVLLNRIGRTSLDDFGSSTSGLNVNFTSGAGDDIHLATGSFGLPLTGTYQADGRNIDPSSVWDTTARTALLDGFLGQPAAGEYRLFIADLSAGDVSQLTRFTLSLTGTVVPEPGSALLALTGFGTMILRRKRPGVDAVRESAGRSEF